MPIKLVDRRTERTLTIGDSTIRFFLPGGDVGVAEWRRAYGRLSAEQWKRTDREEIETLADVRLCARCVTDWEGFIDSTDQPIPWPDQGKATSVPGRENPEPEALRLREALLANLPAPIFHQLQLAVSEEWRKAVASGKGSPTG